MSQQDKYLQEQDLINIFYNRIRRAIMQEGTVRAIVCLHGPYLRLGSWTSRRHVPRLTKDQAKTGRCRDQTTTGLEMTKRGPPPLQKQVVKELGCVGIKSKKIPKPALVCMPVKFQVRHPKRHAWPGIANKLSWLRDWTWGKTGAWHLR